MATLLNEPFAPSLGLPKPGHPERAATTASPEKGIAEFSPLTMADPAARKLLRWCARTLASRDRSTSSLEVLREEVAVRVRLLGPKRAVEVESAASVLVDLAAHGWTVSVDRSRILIDPPKAHEGVAERKAQVRAGHLLDRDAQLSTAPVRKFIREMERQRPHKGQWHSIFSLMRDGGELAETLRRIPTLDEAERDAVLASAIDPYIQVAGTNDVCQVTGLRLLDVWRYFRHTWTTSYKSTPGRKMYFLIRDRAGANHPVLGIGALGSAIVQLRARDTWIGWTGDQVLASMEADPSAAWAGWVERSLKELIKGHRAEDLLRSTRLSDRILDRPTEKALERLRALALRSRERHRRLPQRKQHKTASRTEHTDWHGQSSTHLFRAKRAEALGALLEAKLQLRRAGFEVASQKALEEILKDSSARRAIRTLARFTKARHVGVDIMDITVCGAVAPYNGVLGGKLASLLMASPDVVEAYTKRYRRAPSVIASSMAGRPSRRTPHLVLLGTTSLYDVAPSQYNRLVVPADVLGGPASLEFKNIGSTEGYGSHQFSAATIKLLEKVMARKQSGRRVNSIFGEGVNPKLRKVREALDALGLPSDALLQHGSPRIIFAVPLATNYREVLLGLEKQPQYIVPGGHAGTERIVAFWRRRWLARRIENTDVLARAAEHTLAHPVTHGARVMLPPVAEEAQEGSA